MLTVAARFVAFVAALLNFVTGLVLVVWLLAACADGIVWALTGSGLGFVSFVAEAMRESRILGMVCAAVGLDLWRRSQRGRIDNVELNQLRTMLIRHREDEPTRIRGIVAAMRTRGEL